MEYHPKYAQTLQVLSQIEEDQKEAEAVKKKEPSLEFRGNIFPGGCRNLDLGELEKLDSWDLPVSEAYLESAGPMQLMNPSAPCDAKLQEPTVPLTDPSLLSGDDEIESETFPLRRALRPQETQQLRVILEPLRLHLRMKDELFTREGRKPNQSWFSDITDLQKTLLEELPPGSIALASGGTFNKKRRFSWAACMDLMLGPALEAENSMELKKRNDLMPALEYLDERSQQMQQGADKMAESMRADFMAELQARGKKKVPRTSSHSSLAASSTQQYTELTL